MHVPHAPESTCPDGVSLSEHTAFADVGVASFSAEVLITDGTRAVHVGPMGDVLSHPFPMPTLRRTYSWPAVVANSDADFAGTLAYLVSTPELDHVITLGQISRALARYYIEFQPR